MKTKKVQIYKIPKKDLIAYALISLVASIFFFQVLRVLIFDTIPHDAYNIIVKYWLGEEELASMQSPTFYRFLYTGLAAFLVNYGPKLIILGNMSPNMDLHEAHIWQSLAIVSSFFYMAFLVSVYHFVIKVHRSFSLSIATVFVCSNLIYFCAYFGVDPLTLCWIFWILLVRDNKIHFSLLLIAAIFVNDKIPLIFFVYYLSLFTISFSKQFFHLLISIFACFGYYFLTKMIPLSGYEDQWKIATYPIAFLNGFKMFLTLKGFYLNLLPCLILFYLFLNQYRINPNTQEMKSILVVTIFMISLGIAFAGNITLDGEYCIGRYALHALPFFIPLIAKFLYELEGTFT